MGGCPLNLPSSIQRLERLRRIWTPGDEIQELVADLDPGTEVDSMIRHFLHAALQQHWGSVTIDMGAENVGMLRWEIVHGPGPQGLDHLRPRQATIWVEDDR